MPVCSRAYHSVSGNLFVMHPKHIISLLPANLKLFVRALLVSWVTLRVMAYGRICIAFGDNGSGPSCY